MPICRQQNLCGCVAFTKVRLKVKKFGKKSELFYYGIISISAWLSLSCANSVVFEEQR